MSGVQPANTARTAPARILIHVSFWLNIDAEVWRDPEFDQIVIAIDRVWDEIVKEL